MSVKASMLPFHWLLVARYNNAWQSAVVHHLRRMIISTSARRVVGEKSEARCGWFKVEQERYATSLSTSVLFNWVTSICVCISKDRKLKGIWFISCMLGFISDDMLSWAVPWVAATYPQPFLPFPHRIALSTPILSTNQRK